MRHGYGVRGLAYLMAMGVAAPILAADALPCSGFTWNVAHERALFAGAATQLTAGSEPATAPALVPERLYALQLQPLARVRFVTAPGKSKPGEDTYAGVAALQITTPGTYFIAADAPFWIDVVADGGLVTAKAFQGAHDCNAPHKIVVFDFPVARQFMLQFSGAAGADVRFSVTAAGQR